MLLLEEAGINRDQQETEQELLSRNEYFVIILVAQLVMTVTVTGCCNYSGNRTAIPWLIISLFSDFPYKHSVLYSRFKINELEQNAATWVQIGGKHSKSCFSKFSNKLFFFMVFKKSSWKAEMRKDERCPTLPLSSSPSQPPSFKVLLSYSRSRSWAEKAACRQIPDQRLKWECGCRVTHSPSRDC